MGEEIFKTIKEFPNYEISSFGRVRNKKTSRVLKPSKDKVGYLKVNLYENGKHKMFSIHRLVALYFIDNPNNYNEVNHKDENKENNRIENLEWCSREYNMNYGTRTEKCSKKLTNRKDKSKQIVVFLKDGSLVGEFQSLSECERKIGYSQGNISMCLQGKKNSKKYDFKLKI